MRGKLNFFWSSVSAVFLFFYILFKTGRSYELFGQFIVFCEAVFYEVISSPLELFVYLTFFLFSLSAVVFFLRFIKIKLLLLRQAEDLSCRSHFKNLLEELGLQDKVIVVKDKKPYAKVVGIASQKIVVSNALIESLDEKELKSVLLHEKSHFQNKDNFWRTFFFFLTHSTPFFILLKPLFDWMVFIQETKADEYAIRNLKTKKPLLFAMKKLVLYSKQDFYSAYGDNIEDRINFLVKKQMPAKFFFLIFSLLILFFIIILPAQAKQSKNQFCVKGTRCSIHCT